MPAPKTIVITMERDKETKNAVRYKATDPPIGDLYLQKSGLPGKPPDKIQATIEL